MPPRPILRLLPTIAAEVTVGRRRKKQGLIKMFRKANPILAMAALVFVAMGVFVAVLARSVPAHVENAALLARTPSLTRAARIVAEAISTPPEPVPSWLAFLHPWQALRM